MPATRPPLFYGVPKRCNFLKKEIFEFRRLLNFAFWTFSFEANLIEKWPGGGPPAAYATKARDLRYTLLVKGCTEVGASTLLTGQYADDQVETVLMRIATSSSLSGLRGIPAARDLSSEDLSPPDKLASTPLQTFVQNDVSTCAAGATDGDDSCSNTKPLILGGGGGGGGSGGGSNANVWIVTQV